MFFLSAGQMSDARGALALLGDLPATRVLLADKGHDADWFREALRDKGIASCIPARRGRRNPASHDRALYRQRHRIENLFARIKDWRRIATDTTDAASCSSPPSASPQPIFAGCES